MFQASQGESRAASTLRQDRMLARTPSPTPSEVRLLQGLEPLDWQKPGNWEFWTRKEWVCYYVIFVTLLIVSISLHFCGTEIVRWLIPVATRLHSVSFGWIVLIAVLFIISFPPLFGHEIVILLCGLVWGLWVGFGVAFAGTVLGEVGSYYTFGYCCRSRSDRLQKTNMSYDTFARVVRERGFRIVLVARLSAIPGHLTTPIFSTCGVGFIPFFLAVLASIPKQFIAVYLGSVLKASATGMRSNKVKVIGYVVLGVADIVSLGMMWWVLHEMEKQHPIALYTRRKARQAKLAQDVFYFHRISDVDDSPPMVDFSPPSSDTEIPLRSRSGYGMTPSPDGEGQYP